MGRAILALLALITSGAVCAQTRPGLNLERSRSIANILGAAARSGRGDMTDRLTLTRAFEGAGIHSEAAERIATEIYDAIHDNVATKSDLRDLEQRLKIWLGSLIIAAVTVLFAALHYWPPKWSRG